MLPVPGLPPWALKFTLDLLFSGSAVVAIFIGVRRNRPAGRLPWFLIAANQVICLTGDLFFYGYHYVLHDVRFPAPADVFYFSKYAFLIAGLILIARRRSAGADRTSVVDALILASGATLLIWEFLIRPYLGGDLGVFERAASLGSPAMDAVVVGVALRLVVGGGKRVPSFFLLLGSVFLLLVTDTIYGAMQLAGIYSAGNFLDGTWLASYFLLGAAALHPSMAAVAEPATRRDLSAPFVRVATLAGAALVGPLMLAISDLVGYEMDELVLAAVCAFVFALVIARLYDLMGAQARANAALELRESELRDAVEALRETERERARLLDEVVKASEDERMRVAGELHDGPIQQLTALSLTLDLTSLHGERGDMNAVLAAIEKARQTAAAQMLALRRLMVELRPPALDEIGLEAALRDYVSEFNRHSPVRCAFVGDIGERRLGTGVETTLYRVAQEALTNVGNHAQASSVRLVLSCDATSVCLRIDDDGVGFDERVASELIRAGQFGLVGMRERVERAGGSWEISTARGQGTVVEARVPVPPAMSRAA
jgi:signal transduction histidine kinase